MYSQQLPTPVAATALVCLHTMWSRVACQWPPLSYPTWLHCSRLVESPAAATYLGWLMHCPPTLLLLVATPCTYCLANCPAMHTSITMVTSAGSLSPVLWHCTPLCSQSPASPHIVSGIISCLGIFHDGEGKSVITNVIENWQFNHTRGEV